MKHGTRKRAAVSAGDSLERGGTGAVGARLWSYRWGAAFVAFWLIGMAVRLHGVLTRGYNGDTLSTLYYFVKLPPLEIMTSLALPNNHALSTLMMKVSIGLFGQTPLGIRLPAFLFGLLTPVLAAAAAFFAFRNRLAALFAMALAAGDGALIYYGSAGRGYSIQIALLMGLVLAVIAYERGLCASARSARWCRICVLAIPFAAVLTIPSSLIFLAPLVALHIGYMALSSRRQMAAGKVAVTAWARECLSQNRPMLLCYGVVAAAMTVWFVVIWQMISEGQVHGTPIVGAGQFARFALGTLSSLGAWPAILLSLPLLLHRRHRCWGVLAFSFVGLSLATAPVTRAGPVRVYTPLLPVLCVSAAGGAMVAIGFLAGTGAIGRRVLAPVGTASLLVLCLWGIQSRASAWVGTLDFHESWFALKDELPRDACIFHPAERGLYLRFYDPGFAGESFARIPREECTVALMEARRDAADGPAVRSLSGIVLKNRSDVLELIVDSGAPERSLHFPNCVASLYHLRSVGRVPSICGRVVLAAISDASPEQTLEIIMALTNGGAQAGRWCMLNPFNQPRSPGRRNMVLAVKDSPVPLAGLIRLEELHGRAVRFFVIDGSSEDTAGSCAP